MGENTPFCNKYSDQEEIALLQEYKSFDEQPLDTKLKKWVEFRKICSVKPEYTPEQLSKKIRGFKNKLDKRKISSAPTDPHQARIFQLSTSIWGDAISKRVVDDDDKPRKKRKVEDGDHELRQLRVKELHLYHQSLLLEIEKKKLQLQLLKHEEEQCVEKTENLENEVHEEEEREEALQCTQSDLLLPKSSEDDEMHVNDEISPAVDEKSCANKRMKRKKDKAVEVNNASGMIIEELAQGEANGKSACRGKRVKVNFTGKIKGGEKIIESSGMPRSLVLGEESEMIEGLCMGIEGMRVGGKRRLIIPPCLGFGEAGFGQVVPPNSWLEYEVDLLAVRPPSH